MTTLVHASSTTPAMVHFLCTVQRLYNFFSSSTMRWDIVMKDLKLSLQSISDTRWSSKANAIKALYSHLPEVKIALEKISNDFSNPEVVSNASSLSLQMNYRFICTLSIWNKILQSIDRINRALQKKDLSLNQAKDLIDGLGRSLQEQRETGFDLNLVEAISLAEKIDIEIGFHTDRIRKKRNDMHNSKSSPEKPFKIEMNTVFDTLISGMNWRYEQMQTVCEDFPFMYGSSIAIKSTEELEKSAKELALKYDEDLCLHDFVAEIQNFKSISQTIIKNILTATPLDILQTMHDFGLVESYPNISIAIRIFLTLPMSTASCEKSFSKLKLIKNYLRSTLGQERLSNLAIISKNII